MSIRQALHDEILVFDGAMGSSIAARGLTADDYWGHDGVGEILVRSRPALIAELHAAYAQAGARVIETNSFGALRATLAAYDLENETLALAREAALLAKGVAHDYSTPARPLFVAGSLGPGTRLPSLGQVGFDELYADYRLSARGLIEGGVDFLLLETSQDPLQIKAALIALRAEMKACGRELPIALTVTLEPAGTLLLGTDLAAFVATFAPLKPLFLGLNCAAGPLELERPIRELAALSPIPLLIQPNAGLPERREGKVVYPLSPERFAEALAGYASELGLGAVGGCCGTTPAHIARLADAVKGLAPKGCQAAHKPALASLYTAQPLKQLPPPLLIGERTNANGSKRFRELLLTDDVEAGVALALDQEREGAQAIDLCVAYVGRDERADMQAYAARFAKRLNAPLCLDSTKPEVLRAALKCVGGRPLLNSINLEDGEAKAREVLALAAEYGAALVALVIDERGMARSAAHKLDVAERLLALAAEYGLGPADLLIDMLTFTVADATGEINDPARQTLLAIREYKKRHPDGLTILGVSNVSFGLKPALRPILTSAFLTLAVEAGLDAAIVDAAKIRAESTIEPAAWRLATDLLLAKPSPEEALNRFLALAATAGPAGADTRPAESPDLESRIKERIKSGRRGELPTLLAAALTTRDAGEIVSGILVPAMQEVGAAFGAGRLPLPFVLQAAETMRYGVDFLAPALAQSRQTTRGTLVLATVKGDVHDIGKNLVDIILSGNGYNVLNLGIKVPVQEMLEAYKAQGADAIGMSGLLVKSTEIMRDNLHELAKSEPKPPVILGGAALNREFVERDLRAFYGPDVHYAADAFEGLRILEDIVARKAAGSAPGEAAATGPAPISAPRATLARPQSAPAPMPAVPFLGARTLAIPASALVARLNRESLFLARWHLRRGSLSREEHAELLAREGEPVLEKLLQTLPELIEAQARYGYWRCRAQGEEVVLLDETSHAELARFAFPADAAGARPSAAWRLNENLDRIGAFVATIGPKASLETARLFASGAWRDYLHLHGLSVELAEAAAEFVHETMRAELGLGAGGLRLSFGYPACPDLAQQGPLLALLGANEIGVGLSESFQMTPEQSVSALVFLR